MTRMTVLIVALHHRCFFLNSKRSCLHFWMRSFNSDFSTLHVKMQMQTCLSCISSSFSRRWQKTATTSLHLHLAKHPELSKSLIKEPEFLSYSCKFEPPDKCPNDSKSTWYIEDVLKRSEYIASRGSIMVFESSTHMVRGGARLAPALRRSMPWLKLILSMREPISRAASMLIHNFDKGRGCMNNENGTLVTCLVNESQISVRGGYLLDTPRGPYAPTNYTDVLKSWLQTWPAEQVSGKHTI